MIIHRRTTNKTRNQRCLRVSVAEIKRCDQTEEEGYSTYISISQIVTEDTQGRNSKGARTRRWELMQWPWKGAANWLAP